MWGQGFKDTLGSRVLGCVRPEGIHGAVREWTTLRASCSDALGVQVSMPRPGRGDQLGAELGLPTPWAPRVRGPAEALLPALLRQAWELRAQLP